MSKTEVLNLVLKVAENAITPGDYAAVNLHLFPLGLARWHGRSILLSERGRRLIFQHNCKLALEAILEEGFSQMNESVRCWLLKHEFILHAQKNSDEWQVTPRGQDWLSQLD